MNPASLVGHVLELLKLTDARHQPADRIISQFFRERSYLGSRDRRFISEYAFGIIRHRRFLEALLEQYLAQHPHHNILDHPLDRHLTILTFYYLTLETDARQLYPDSLWKIKFPSVDLAGFTEWVHRHSSLEFLENDHCIQLGVRYSFQDWMVEEWLEAFGESTESLLQSLNAPAPTALRVNGLKTTREECQTRLGNEGIETRVSKISPDALIAQKRFTTQSSPAFKEGFFEVQDEGSQLVSRIVNPQPGQIVIDACAGAGGKSLHLAALMGNQGEIIAIDVEAKRLSELERRAGRAGVKIIRAVPRDRFEPGNLVSTADIVLIDAPCSGSGTIRRNPGFKWSITESLVDHYSKMQSEIIHANAKFVRPGGNLVYATCSLFRKENEKVVGEFLASHAGFLNTTPSVDLSLPDLGKERGYISILPHLHDTDGFIIHILTRKL